MKSKTYVAWGRVSCAVPLLLACGTKEPCPGVVDGAVYDIEVGIETEPSVPASGCQDGWGFSSGLVLSATAWDLEDEGVCLVAVPTLEGVPDWSFAESNTEVSSRFMSGLYRATSANCTGLVSLDLVESGSKFPCFQHGGGKTDACVMKLTFEPRTGGCAASCNAFLATTVTRR